MTNTQSNADLAADTLHAFTAPVRDLIVNVRKIEASFKQEREYILQHRPDEQVGDFPLLDGLDETMNIVDLELLKTSCFAALKEIQQHADKVQAEVDEAERIRAEQNMTEEQAWRNSVNRAIAYLAAEVRNLKGAQRPPAPDVAPNRPPWAALLTGTARTKTRDQRSRFSARRHGSRLYAENSSAGRDRRRGQAVTHWSAP